MYLGAQDALVAVYPDLDDKVETLKKNFQNNQSV